MATVRELGHVIEARRRARSEIREAMNEYCWRVYGINDFFGRVDKLFGFYTRSQSRFTLCLARQVPTMNVEHAALVLLERWLGETLAMEVMGLPLALYRDVYSAHNAYKRSLVKVPWLGRGRRKRFVFAERIVDRENATDNVVFSEMPTTIGLNLPEFHQQLRNRAFDSNCAVIDVSPLWQEFLTECLKGDGLVPRTLYRRAGRREERILASRANPADDDLRPPAEWIYLLYLMLFVDGSMGLLSTVGDDPEVDDWFKKAIKTIEGVASFTPLIIPTPKEVTVDGFRSEFLEFPRPLLEGRWGGRITMPPYDARYSIFDVVRHLEEEIIKLV